MMQLKRRGSRLFRKYFLAFMAMLLSSFLFLGSAFLAFSLRYWTRDKLTLLAENTKRATNLAELIYQPDADSSPTANQQVLRSLLQTTSDAVDADFFVCNAQGRVVACRDEVPTTFLPAPVHCVKHATLTLSEKVIARALAGPYTVNSTLDGAFEEQMLVATNPYFLNGKAAGFVVAVQPVNEGLFTYLGSIMRLFFLSSILCFAFSFVVVYYISFRLVCPVREMLRATKHYAKGDFSFRVKTKDEDELGALADEFNAMAVSLATLEASRRNFVANVSHELKTPMTTIGGFIDGMLDGTIPHEKHAHYLGVVSEEVKRLSRLVTGMLNMSKIEAGELQLNPVQFDVSELLFHTILSFEQLIARKNILLVGLEELEPMKIRGDKDMLTQVFYNLIDNAVKFTPPGERMEFYVQLHASQKDDKTERIFCFGLRNTGVGISSEEIARIFERFYKTDRSRSYDVKGAGLGLYLTKTIVEMHGGQIKADSDGETYTEFAVLLPV
ncbi:MAG: HAMP domain-containing histidine kinase [Oscillospiraceae bacterium]|jgi:signal transduction histidine kinase|nr:HAMP domain-containing histidine kinase [Oscillospiraceae bacterium]